jgi:hypothetical protein
VDLAEFSRDCVVWSFTSGGVYGTEMAAVLWGFWKDMCSGIGLR